MILIHKFLSELLFWVAWIVIPLLFEITPALVGFYIVYMKKRFRKEEKPIEYFPYVTVLIPVYNSSKTLAACIDSVMNSDYPRGNIELLMIDNGSKDDSYNIFMEYQQKYFKSNLFWLRSQPGKSKALNQGLFSCSGKYIINIDSDGILDPQALKTIVTKFEQNPHIDCLAGSILIDPKLVDEPCGPFLKLLRYCEFMEYCEAFLIGRIYQSEMDALYTLSGAFSSFRKEVVLKTQLYNSITVGEDTHITFQIRNLLKSRIYYCEDAFFFVDPIENLNKLYTQRQRWQRGEIEVSSLFLRKDLQAVKGFLKNFTVRILMYDHTFAFPRAIWYFAIIYLYFINYPFKLIIGSTFFLYILFVVACFLFFSVGRMYLDKHKKIQRYYTRKWYICFLLPIYNFMIYWFRLAGIINSMTMETKWRTNNLTEEVDTMKKALMHTFRGPIAFIKKLKETINRE